MISASPTSLLEGNSYDNIALTIGKYNTLAMLKRLLFACRKCGRITSTTSRSIYSGRLCINHRKKRSEDVNSYLEEIGRGVFG